MKKKLDDASSSSTRPRWSLSIPSRGESSSNPSQGESSSTPSQGESSSTPSQGESSSSSSSTNFPVGLRVLLVDDDKICLTIVGQMLTDCKYEVTTCNLPKVALSILRERKDGFDVVITDVHMPEMNGFQLLELIGLEMEIPVVMMSVDCNVEVARKGIEHGACYYLMKPVRIEEVRNLWQHVILWKKNLDEQAGNGEDNSPKNSSTGNVERGEDAKLAKRTRDDKVGDEDNDEDINDENVVHKKHRVIWNTELHNQFLKAVNQLGYDRAVPKKILEIMNAPGITRENIASHLQKYRIYLRRLSEPDDHTLKPNLGTFSHHWMSNYRNEMGQPICPWKINPMGSQPGFVAAGHMHNLNPPIPMQPVNPMQFPDHNHMGNPMARFNLGHTPGSGPTNFQQQPPGFERTGPPYLMQQNSGNSGLGMGPNLTSMNPASFGDISAGLMRSNSTMPMVHQQQGAPPGISSGGYFSGPNVHGHNFNSGMENGGQLGNSSQLPSSNYAGLCMTSTGGLYGMTRTGPIFEASSNTDSESNSLDDIRKGKRPMVMDDGDPTMPEFSSMNFGYNHQGPDFFDGMTDANQTATRFADVTPGEDRLMNDSQLDIANNAAFGESSIPKQFSDDDLDDLFLQQLDGLDFTFPDFDFSSFHLDDNDSNE